MTYAKKVDLNHTEIVKTFRDLGATVFDASGIGRGFPDIVLGYNNITCLVEIKSVKKRNLQKRSLNL